MAASTDIKDSTRALLQLLKAYLNAEELSEEDPDFVHVYIYTASNARDANGEPLEHKYPCVVLEGPSIEEHKIRRLKAVEDYGRVTDPESEDYLTYYARPYPRYYNLYFQIVLQATNPMQFIDLQERVNGFFQVTAKANGYLLDVESAIGSFERPGGVDLIEAAGEIVVWDVRVYPDTTGVQGGLIETAEFSLGDLESEALYQNSEEKVVIPDE